MKAQELKLNNLVSVKKFETDINYKTYKVKGIELKNDIGYVSVDNFVKEDKFVNPIELNEKNLNLIPNFKKLSNEAFICNIFEGTEYEKEILLLYTKNEYNLYIIHKISDEKYYLMISKNIKYVHKLQNIYNDVFQIDLDINKLI